ncbi:MAG: nitroreductase [Dehalococcoidia bacterium]|nr:nitroreductase [Dehalococcoidia bacterium]
MDVQEAIRQRRSAGAFAPGPLPRAVIERLLEAARWAPNHHHTEPWRFHVLAGDAREALADAAVARMEVGEARSVRTKLVRSPVVVVVAQHREPDPAAERDLEDYAAVACATQNLLLAAHSEGLAAKWSTGSLATSPGVKAHLGLNAHDRIVAFVYLGRPAEGVTAPTAARGDAIVDWRGF